MESAYFSGDKWESNGSLHLGPNKSFTMCIQCWYKMEILFNTSHLRCYVKENLHECAIIHGHWHDRHLPFG